MSSSLTSSSSSDAAAGLATLADVVCGVDVVIGTGSVKVRQFLQLGRDSVVRLDETAGADLQLRVNGVALAEGEVAVVDDNAALRITKIAVPTGVGWD